MKFTNLQHEAQKIRMTPGEKASMRARIFSVPSPLAPSRVEGYFFFSYQFMTHAMAALLVVVVVGGVGTASAAQGALPGDLLYSVKINVDEPVEVALARTPVAKAKVEASIATRRVAEAQALAAQGRLDATTTQQIQDNFNQHASRALALAGGEARATAASSTLAARVEGRQADRQAREGHTPRTTMAIAVAPAASTTSGDAAGEVASSTTHSNTDDIEKDISASLDVQNNILEELKLHIKTRDHRDTQSNVQQSDHNSRQGSGSKDSQN